MTPTQPKVYVVGLMEQQPGLGQYLLDIGIPEWTSDAATGGDLLCEVGGRVCYRSWIPWDPARPDASNPNVGRVREGNQAYLANIRNQGHGSVFEHAYIAAIFRDVSRVFTHELVRHRAGFGYSQESLRFVRLDRLKAWIPDSVRKLGPEAVTAFGRRMEIVEGFQTSMAAEFAVDSKEFTDKKKLTSMMRRLAPLGLATTIMATGNVRAWRHVVNMRSAGGAEEEMQIVMDQLAPLLKDACPAGFADLTRSDGGIWQLEIPKV